MPALAIEAEGLTRTFNGIRACTDLSFSVFRGEMFCIVGPDGAGKSTAIRLLSGILKPTAGRAQVLGFDLTSEADEIKKRIGYLSQRFTLYGDLTVDENLEFVAEIHDVRDFKKRREELLKFTRLEPFRRRLAENLSGGMKQKLALAATLVHGPELLLLDEPTTGVDPLSRQEFWRILFGLLEREITVVMTTPYLDEAERSHRVALMDQGSILDIDTPAGMKKRLAGTAVEIVCEDVGKASALIRNMESVLEVQAFGDRLVAVVHDFDLDLPDVLRRLEGEGI
ncbi:MAG: ABC transporter ATP-binding protein, partial [Candidatus Aminicenantes bacterium]|nr:ABC transporter ATP-binding protein [Candidatus Aminicenantes bacterium]